MKYTKKYHTLHPENGCKLHLKMDWGVHLENNKYVLPTLSDEIYLAKNLSKEQALELYEDVPLNELDEYKKTWKQKIKEQEQLEQQEHDIEIIEPELEDFEEVE